MASDNKDRDELNIDEIASDRIKHDLLEVAGKQLNSTNFGLNVSNGSNKVMSGTNFMGDIYRINCQDKSNEQNETSVILKIAPKHLLRREKFQLRNLFCREIVMYDEVLSYLNEFQLLKGITPSENGFDAYPKCYSNISDNLCESLILEDLKLKHFEVVNIRKESISFDHMSLFLKALAEFHAISFSLKDQQPEKFKQLSSQLEELFWDAKFGEFFDISLNYLTNCLKEQQRFDLFDKLNKVAGDDSFKTIKRLISSVSAEPFAVICHGDPTVNNSMFCTDQHKKPTAVKLFDWQFSRYASPVTDLVLYLICTSTKELRKHHDDFVKIYHDSLSDMLVRLGSDPNKVFPYEALLEQMKQFGVYAVFVSALLFPIMFADTETMPDFNDLPEHLDVEELIFRIPDELKPAYNQRVTDMFDDMAYFGYI